MTMFCPHVNQPFGCNFGAAACKYTHPSRVCEHFLRGNCTRGNLCTFLHPQPAPARYPRNQQHRRHGQSGQHRRTPSPPSLDVRVHCPHFNKPEGCRHGAKCRHKHPTVDCVHHSQGYCSKGHLCTFVHRHTHHAHHAGVDRRLQTPPDRTVPAQRTVPGAQGAQPRLGHGRGAPTHTGVQCAMFGDACPPTAFTRAAWTSLQDALYQTCKGGAGYRSTRARAAHRIAKAMKVIQEDYGHRFTSVGIKVHLPAGCHRAFAHAPAHPVFDGMCAVLVSAWSPRPGPRCRLRFASTDPPLTSACSGCLQGAEIAELFALGAEGFMELPWTVR